MCSALLKNFWLATLQSHPHPCRQKPVGILATGGSHGTHHTPPAAYSSLATSGRIAGAEESSRKIDLLDEQLKFGENWLLLDRLALVCHVIVIYKYVYVSRRQHESFVTSNMRLIIVFCGAEKKAYSDPALRAYRKHLGWAVLRQNKNMEANSLANGQFRMGVRFTLRVAA